MRGKIFHSMLLLTMLALLLSTGLFLHRSYTDHLIMKQERQWQMETFLLAGVEADAEAFFATLNEDDTLYLYIFHFASDGTLLAGRDDPQDASESFARAQENMAAGRVWQSFRDDVSGERCLAQLERLDDGSFLYWETLDESFLAIGVSTFWYLLILLVLGVFAAHFCAGRITRALTKPFDDARLEDLVVQDVCQELQPMAARVLDQNRTIQKQLLKQRAELKLEYEKQDRTRRDFTANVSHELKTPLTSLSGYAEIIRDGLVREEDVPRFAGKIYDEAQRMIVLVGDILKLSQLDEGNQTHMERVPLDLYAICERVIARLQTAAAAKGVTFDLSGAHGQIVGVEQIVDEIVYNLCDNAIKYNLEGGTASVSVSLERDKVVLAVKDSGIGISPEEQDRVFERFYRVDKSHSKEIGGTGLGLSIVKHGAAYHEARIEMDSKLGEGTRFRVLFQRAE